MNNELYRIVYCSRNLMVGTAATDSHDAELQQILRSAREKNAAASVTGALLFNDEYFAQVLEGPRLAVEAVFERIQRDRRHSQVTVVENGWAATRDFPDWAMAHAQPDEQTPPEGLAATLSLALIQPREAGGEVLDLLKSLVIAD